MRRMPRGQGTAAAVEPHLDALYDFALTVTWDPQAATEAVEAAIDRVGDHPDRAHLFQATREESLERARPADPVVVDPEGELPEMDEDAGPEALEPLALEPLRGLDPSDRAVLDLVVRQRLDEDELATALGVSLAESQGVVEEVQARTGRLLGHALLARVGSSQCDGLARTVGSAPAGLAALADAVDHHLRECDDCRTRRRGLPSPASFLPSVPARPAPPRLRRLVPTEREPFLRSIFGGGEGEEQTAGWRRMAFLGLVAAAVAVAVLVVLSLLGGGDEEARKTAGALALDAETIDLGTDRSTAEVSVENTGEEPISWAAEAEVPWLEVTPRKGTLDGGSSVVLDVAFDRAKAPEGEQKSSIVVRAGDETAEVNVSARVARPPKVTGAVADDRRLVTRSCRRGDRTTNVSAQVQDESKLHSVTVIVRTPPGPIRDVPMKKAADGTWSAEIGAFGQAGIARWAVEAVDTGGNTTRTDAVDIRVSDDCPKRRR
jgi:hypothetical protein